MNLHPAEKICAGIIATLLVFDAILIPVRGVGVDWINYTLMSAIGLTAIGVGQFYRTMRPEEKIALAATASGLFILFTIVGSVFNYLLLPVGLRRIDDILTKFDAYLGFSWTDAVIYVASMPALGSLLRWIYASSMPQLILIILILGFSGQRDGLHRFLLTGLIGALISIALWAMFPSSGPAAFEILPASISSTLDMVVGSSYGAELNRLALEGPTFLSPKDALGLIAFPSFHTVMACMAVWFMFRMAFAFPVFLIINILMLPAILVHGGHHFVDVIGGFAVFGIALFASKRLVRSTRLSPVPA
ncbi:phosphatase PAP2 family protein [Phyllobacterium meliloti]|uniref:phosphatase PAP2 family protein n=1 Tax=Phyllobacterium meliloti TaxID=555317 RepID=UPI001D135E7C|nr:phosphatase PAP2 family protein [Phyllobacterium sp. T1293]UGX87522.1 phosphatase PAP2 family protein [Phyllobacterium sp. T1293]